MEACIQGLTPDIYPPEELLEFLSEGRKRGYRYGRQIDYVVVLPPPKLFDGVRSGSELLAALLTHLKDPDSPNQREEHNLLVDFERFVNRECGSVLFITNCCGKGADPIIRELWRAYPRIVWYVRGINGRAGAFMKAQLAEDLFDKAPPILERPEAEVLA